MYLLYKYGSIASVQIFSPFKPRCVKKKVSGKLLVGKGGGVLLHSFSAVLPARTKMLINMSYTILLSI